jgi:hypothetical protein
MQQLSTSRPSSLAPMTIGKHTRPRRNPFSVHGTFFKFSPQPTRVLGRHRHIANLSWGADSFWRLQAHKTNFPREKASKGLVEQLCAILSRSSFGTFACALKRACRMERNPSRSATNSNLHLFLAQHADIRDIRTRVATKHLANSVESDPDTSDAHPTASSRRTPHPAKRLRLRLSSLHHGRCDDVPDI